jgi:hypothetical protein
MAEPATTTGAAAVAGATLAAAAVDQMLDAQGVIFGAALGAGVCAWAQHARAFAATVTWVAAAVGTFLVAVVAGVVIPYVLYAYAPAVGLLQPARSIPGWILALGAAAGSQFLLTLAGRWASARAASLTPTTTPQEPPNV